MNLGEPALLDFHCMAAAGIFFVSNTKKSQGAGKKYFFEEIEAGHSRTYVTSGPSDNRRVRSSLGCYQNYSGRQFTTKAVPGGLRVHRVR